MRDGSFEDRQRGRQRLESGFADQKMHVLRHDNIARDLEVIEFAGGLEDILKDGLCLSRMQIWVAVVAAEGYEVMVPEILMTLKPGGHGRSLHDRSGAPSQTVVSFEVGFEDAGPAVVRPHLN